MTCVVGLETRGRVILGGDSSCVDANGDGISTLKASKVFRVGSFVVGFAGSFAVGDLLKHKVVYPKKKTDVPHRISEALREAFKDIDLMGDAWEALFGVDGRLYMAQNDFYVYRHGKPYAAIGGTSALSVSLGTMATLEKIAPGMDGREKLKLALDNASMFSANVRGPWRFCATPIPK